MENNNTVPTTFPDDYAHPKVKAGKAWGLQAARAINANNKMTNNKVFFNNKDEMKIWLEYAFGKQDISQYNPKASVDPKDKSAFKPKNRYAYEIKNYATKRVNITSQSIANMDYDTEVTSTDPLAVDERQQFEAQIKVLMKYNEWYKTLQQYASLIPEGMSEDMLPTNNDELELMMQTNYKDWLAMKIEMGVEYLKSRGSYNKLKRVAAQHLTILNGAVICTGMDNNGWPWFELIQPEDAIIPYSEDGFFMDMPYAGHIKRLTIAQAKKLWAGQFDTEIEKSIVDKYGYKNGQQGNGNSNTNNPFFNNNRHDNDRINVMFFRIKTTNEIVNLKYTDMYGNERFVEKDYDYYRKANEQEKFKAKYGNTREVVRKQYTAIYEGYWIVDSEHVFNYGPMTNVAYPTDNGVMGEPLIGYSVVSPSYLKGLQASLMSQMIPSLNDLQFYNKKFQDIFSEPFPGGMLIDLFALRKAQFTMDGKDFTESDLIKMAIENKIILIDSSQGNYAAGSNYKAVEALNLGNQLSDILLGMQQALLDLDEITGFNKIAAGSDVNPDLGAKVSKMQLEATNKALGPLYDADRFLWNDVSKNLAILFLQSVKYDTEGKWDSILGKESVERIKKDTKVLNYDFAMHLVARPTEEQWAEFYADLDGFVKTGQLGPEDKVAIRRITNLKQAQWYLTVLSRRRKKEAAQSQMQQIQANTDAQAQSNMQANELAMGLEQAKQETLILGSKLKREEMLLEMKLKRQMAMENTVAQMQSKERIAEENNDAKLEIAAKSAKKSD